MPPAAITTAQTTTSTTASSLQASSSGTTANLTTATQPPMTTQGIGQQHCRFVRCSSIDLTLPEDQNHVLVDFSNYIAAVDADSNQVTPEVDNVMSQNVTYPTTKYEVGPDEEPPYLFPTVTFRACNDTCEVSVILQDNTAPRVVSCSTTDQNLQGGSCRDVMLHDYYSSSTIASWFRDNVGIREERCTRTIIDSIAIGETATTTCYTTDMTGNRSLGCDINFHCMKHECPTLRPPEFGAIVCHEDGLMVRCALFCKEGKIHNRQNIFTCDMADASATWTGAMVDDDIICQDRSRARERFTFTESCDPDDVDFHLSIKQTLSTRESHELCEDLSIADCEITVSCGNSTSSPDD
ncbi:uncharacterized protein [Branchiostoma lanceolatum]|uniref:uncharacterized protein n=1 Tax=Branchiostoma lanceolatum TaxID=7740 RepID=UPI003451B3EB